MKEVAIEILRFVGLAIMMAAYVALISLVSIEGCL